MSGTILFGMAAILPLAIGPLPSQNESITARLCNGGTIQIPLKRGGDPAVPCPAKACHAGSCRKRFDLAQ